MDKEKYSLTTGKNNLLLLLYLMEHYFLIYLSFFIFLWTKTSYFSFVDLVKLRCILIQFASSNCPLASLCQQKTVDYYIIFWARKSACVSQQPCLAQFRNCLIVILFAIPHYADLSFATCLALYSYIGFRFANKREYLRDHCDVAECIAVRPYNLASPLLTPLYVVCFSSINTLHQFSFKQLHLMRFAHNYT